MPARTTPRPWSPSLWGAHLLLVVVLAATVLLGYWQFHVSRDHRAQQVTQLAHEQPKPLGDVMGNNDPFPGDELGRPVTISGTWVPGATLYVSQPGGGYWVISPIAVGRDASAPAMYVVRGWSRTTTSTQPTGPVTVVGWLEPDVSDMSLTDTNPKDDVLPQLQLSLAMPHVHQDLYGGYAVIADQQGGWSVATHNDGTTGLRTVPEPAAPKADPTTGLRNLLYAFQWWLFGCFAIYIWWRHVREVTHPAPVEEPDSADTQDEAVISQA